MKGLKRDILIKLIERNYTEEAVMMPRDLEEIFEQLGDDYFIEYNRWQLFRKNERRRDDLL